MSSTRLPGKSLKRVGQERLLETLVTRASQSTEADMVAVATSTDALDNAIAEWCLGNSLCCVRGSLQDVSDRLLLAATQLEAAFVVRISGDSPFIDPKLIDHAIRLSRERDVDLVTNLFPRTFPKGQSVEVIKVQSLRQAIQGGLSQEQREHVTRVFYDNASDYQIANFSTSDFCGEALEWRDYSKVQLSIDSPADLEMANHVASHLGTGLTDCSWADIAGVWEELNVKLKV